MAELDVPVSPPLSDPAAGSALLPNSETAEAPDAAVESGAEVYAVHGADPEVLAYAMAKYSRSSLSLRESLREISRERAEQFLNTFYFQYGHRSIADLAHVAFAVERLSLLAAIVLVDEQRWDGQERSTRYQNFKRSGWYMPAMGRDKERVQLYTRTVEQLFESYHLVSEGVFSSLRERITRPPEMKPEAYERTLRARAFDVARYLLPLATNTSLGQIVNARTLEMQVSRLLSDGHAEVRELGEKLRRAAAGTAWDLGAKEKVALRSEIRDALGGTEAELMERIDAALLRETRTAPTLVKYAAAQPYRMEARRALAEAAAELMGGAAIADAPVVDLVERTESLEIELAATLLYGACHYSFRQLRDRVAALESSQAAEIIEAGVQSRGRHDELLREFAAGHTLRFDILMDIGGFRDMHRHRRCVQVMQRFTAEHGVETPEGLDEAGLQTVYQEAIVAARSGYVSLAGVEDEELQAQAQYVLPLGTRCRTLFKMDLAEAVYIAELRSAPQGHFSYRRVAWEMFRAVERQHPALARLFRVTDVREPIDILKR